jgi:multidrug transporter EmrE-like cation transporter
MFQYLYIVLLAVIEMMAQYSLKQGVHGGSVWIMTGIVGYSVVAGILFILYSSGKGIGLVQTIWSLLSPFLAMLSGHIFFNERIAPLVLPASLGLLAQVFLAL